MAYDKAIIAENKQLQKCIIHATDELGRSVNSYLHGLDNFLSAFSSKSESTDKIFNELKNLEKLMLEQAEMKVVPLGVRAEQFDDHGLEGTFVWALSEMMKGRYLTRHVYGNKKYVIYQLGGRMKFLEWTKSTSTAGLFVPERDDLIAKDWHVWSGQVGGDLWD